jgi:hypothetical protein
MIPVLVSIVALVAVAAWVVAAVSLFRVIALVPAGQRLSALFSSGFWQFDKVRALGGADVDVHLRRFGYAFGAFFLAIVVGMLIGIVAASTSGGA